MDIGNTNVSREVLKSWMRTGFKPLRTQMLTILDNFVHKDDLYSIQVTSEAVTDALGYTPENTSNKGQANGYASLGSNGKVPSSQLPASSGVSQSDVLNALNYQDAESPGVFAALNDAGKVPLSKMPVDLLENLYAYGIERPMEGQAPTASSFTRVGSMSLHKTLPIQSNMRGCLVNSGIVVEYLPYDTWVNSVLDGSIGNVFVEIPEYYYLGSVRANGNGASYRMMISTIPIPGYKHVPKRYISAYEASMNRGMAMLTSVVNMDVTYRGGDNTADWDGTYRSLLGKPVTNETSVALRAAARKNGIGYCALEYNLYKDLCWLYMIEYANSNVQLPVSGKDSNGFSQGGLGSGVTNMPYDSWNTLYNGNPIVKCGVTNSLGNNSGEVSADVYNSDGSVIASVKVPRYRGIENIFGHLPKLMDGAKVIEKSNIERVSFLVSDTPESFGLGVEGYRDIYDLGKSGGFGYIGKIAAEITGDPEGTIMPAYVSGSTTTGYCDFFYSTTHWSGEHYLQIGGGASDGAAAGLFNLTLAYGLVDAGTEDSYSNVGTRLCYLPQ